MSDKELSPEERAVRGKRLLLYGMFALVVVTFVSVFLTMFLITAPLLGGAGYALQTALIVSVIALVACLIVWFVYTRFVLKH
jgi:hypothetical protein